MSNRLRGGSEEEHCIPWNSCSQTVITQILWDSLCHVSDCRLARRQTFPVWLGGNIRAQLWSCCITPSLERKGHQFIRHLPQDGSVEKTTEKWFATPNSVSICLISSTARPFDRLDGKARVHSNNPFLLSAGEKISSKELNTSSQQMPSKGKSSQGNHASQAPSCVTFTNLWLLSLFSP